MPHKSVHKGTKTRFTLVHCGQSISPPSTSDTVVAQWMYDTPHWSKTTPLPQCLMHQRLRPYTK